MRILCLTSRLPYPPDRGDRLRAFHFIEHLAQDHELTLVSFIAGEAEEGHVAALRDYCREVHVIHKSSLSSAMTAVFNLWRRQPLQLLYYRSAAMQRLVDQLVAEQPFDAVYVHLFRMAPYVAEHRDLYRIVDLTDVISEEIARSLPYRGLLWRLIYTFERPRIVQFERYVARNFDESWLIAEADRRVLSAAVPEANIQVIPNGVDTVAFSPTGSPVGENSLIFVGHLRVFHNVDAAVYLVEEILPLVQASLPDCTVTLVGADPGPAVQALAANPAVTVTGFVPDLNAYLNQAALFAAPLRFAAGVQNKVLEAMAAGLPVVTTSLVNNGLQAEPGRHLLLADDAETMAAQIVALLDDAPRRQALGTAGRRFVQQKFSWQHARRRMAEIERRSD